MSSAGMPPWLQEQFVKMQQIQENLHYIMMQKRNLDMERVDADRTLDMLQGATDTDTIYRHDGSLAIMSTRQDTVDALEEQKLLFKTRSTVLGQQESGLTESLKTEESKLVEMLKGDQPGAPSGAHAQSDDNPRR